MHNKYNLDCIINIIYMAAFTIYNDSFFMNKMTHPQQQTSQHKFSVNFPLICYLCYLCYLCFSLDEMHIQSKIQMFSWKQILIVPFNI